MKRILQIVGTMNRAGAETMVMSLYRAIDKTEYQFDFVYFTERSCDYDNEILELGGRIYRIPETLASSSIRRMFELYKIIKNNRPFHAVHCHQLFSNAFHLIAAFCAGSKQRIAHSHNTSDVNSKTLHGKLYQKFSRKIINLLSTDFIACGNEAGKFLFPNQKNVVFIPNAVNVQKFINTKPSDTAQHFFKIEGISEKTMVLTQIGRLMPVKNVEFSINFAEYLKLKKIDFHICLVGAGRLEKNLRQLVQNKGLEKQISFLGVRSDIEKILANSNALLMPSFHEGFPVILVESQAAGTPALISDRISSEVDLGLNLVEFCSLDASFEDWLAKIYNLKNRKKVPSALRYNALRSAGFDIEVSVKFLENIYNKA